MAVGQLNKVIQHLRATLERQDGAETSDADLLKRYVHQRDEAAFGALVRRHGPMVLGVCRRVLHSLHDGEDAFQATFLVLVRKASSLRSPGMIGNWLYGVAYRTALHARDAAAKRRAKETEMVTRTAAAEDTWADLRLALDQELERLPDKYRAVIVLCDLEGKTRKEATRQLGWAEGTVASRLVRGRALLAKRLAHHGLALSGGALAAALSQNASACVSSSVVSSTIKAASLLAAGQAAAGVVSVKVAVLTEGVLKAMLLNKLKTVTTVLFVALGMVVFGGGLYLHQAEAQQGPADKSPAEGQTDEKKGEAPSERPQGPNKIMVLRASHLALLDPDGKNARTVGEEKLYMLGARLSPDGKKVAALFQTPQKELVPPPVPGEPRRDVKLFVCVLEKKEPWTDLGVMCRFFAWSADGTEIACSDCTDELYPQFNDWPNMKSPEATHFVVNVATKQKTALKLSKDHVITDWSRDGKLFLTTSVDGRASERVARMHLMNRDGTEHKALTNGNQPAMFGRLAPDGKRVLYCTPLTEPETNKRYKLGLDVLDIASGKVDRVQESGDIYSYCWSPDAKRIAYAWREWHEGEFIKLLDKEHKCYLVVCDQDGKDRKTIATEMGRSPATIAIDVEDWQQGDKRFIASDKPPAAEAPMKTPQENDKEKEAFTAWGKEVGGLQAGWGYLPGQKRAYIHGETVWLVVRVRNVGKEKVKFQYLSAYFAETPPAVTDAEGKPVPFGGGVLLLGQHVPTEVDLAPGKEIELHALRLELRPASESGNKGYSTLYGTGKFQIQYERVFGNSSVGTITLDPTLSELATGKLALEVNPAPPPATDKKTKPADKPAEQSKEGLLPRGPYSTEPQGPDKVPQKEGFTAWGKEVGGLQTGLGYRPGEKRAYHHGETVTLVVRIRNVGKETVKFSYLHPFMEHSPAVTDSDGKAVPQPEVLPNVGIHTPGEVELPPGKEIELHELKRQLRPATESGSKTFMQPYALYGTGKVGVQYEHVLGLSEMDNRGWKLDPTLSKLATGKVELEIKSDPPPAAEKKEPQKKDRDDANMKPIKIGVYIEKVNVDTSTITASCVLIGEVDNVTKPLRFENLRVAEKAKITARGKEVKLIDLQLLPRDTPFYLFLKAYEFGGFEVVGIETIRK